MELDEYAGLLEQGGLAHRVDALLGAVRPSVRLAPRPFDPAVDAGRSRISGHPDMAPDAPWPTAPDGRHLAFVAQIDLAEMPGEVTHAVLPTDGWLHLFYDADNQPWGLEPADRGGWALTYTPAGTPLEVRPAPDDQTARYTSDRPVVLEPHVEPTIVPAFSIDSTRVLTDDENHAYGDAVADRVDELEDEDEESPIHRLLGHPDPIQHGEMQLRSQLAANGVGDDRDPAAEGLAEGAVDWHLLLQIDSDPTTGVEFGDAGRIYLMIRDEDLATRRWDRTWLTLQCY